MLEIKCFWLKGFAFPGAVPGSASGAQTALGPHCPLFPCKSQEDTQCLVLWGLPG